MRNDYLKIITMCAFSVGGCVITQGRERVGGLRGRDMKEEWSNAEKGMMESDGNKVHRLVVKEGYQ